MDTVYHIMDLIGRDGVWNIVLIGVGITGTILSKNGRVYDNETMLEYSPEELDNIDEFEETQGCMYQKIASV